MTKAQKHHYIPCFYLKQWVGTDGRLCEFSKPYREVVPRRTSPDGTGYVRGLYTFHDLPPRMANYLESVFLQRTDNLAHQAHAELLKENVDLDGTKRSAWTRFLLSLIHRTPERMAGIRHLIRYNLPAVLGDLRVQYRDEFGEDLVGAFDEFVASINEQHISDYTLACLQRLIDSKEVGERVNEMLWHVQAIPRMGFPLLTADRPIIMTNGLNQSHSHLVIPISPWKLFIATNDRNTMTRLVRHLSVGRGAEKVNDMTVRQARRYVYSIDDTQLRFVLNRFGEHVPSTPLETLPAGARV